MNPTRVIGKMCYALVNYPKAGQGPVIVGLYTSPETALDEFAHFFELRRVVDRDRMYFRGKRTTDTSWAIHEVLMNMAASCGILKESYSVGLTFDVTDKTGAVIVEKKPETSENE